MSLQDTVADMAKDMRDTRTGSAAASAEELYQFMQKVHMCGSCITPDSWVTMKAAGYCAALCQSSTDFAYLHTIEFWICGTCIHHIT